MGNSSCKNCCDNFSHKSEYRPTLTNRSINHQESKTSSKSEIIDPFKTRRSPKNEHIVITFTQHSIEGDFIEESSIIDDGEEGEFENLVRTLISDQRHKILSSNAEKLKSQTSLYNLSLNYYNDLCMKSKQKALEINTSIDKEEDNSISKKLTKKVSFNMNPERYNIQISPAKNHEPIVYDLGKLNPRPETTKHNPNLLRADSYNVPYKGNRRNSKIMSENNKYKQQQTEKAKGVIRLMIYRLFPCINDEDFEFLFKNMIYAEFKENTKLNNHQIENFFIGVVEGDVAYFVNDQKNLVYTEGDAFGEYGVTNRYKFPNASQDNDEKETKPCDALVKQNTIYCENYYKAITDVKCCLISGENINILISIQNEKLTKSMNIIENIPYLKLLSNETKKYISEELEIMTFPKNKVIIRLSEEINSVVYIVSGEIQAKDENGKTKEILKAGNCIFEDYLLEVKEPKTVYFYKTVNHVEIAVLKFPNLKITLSTKFREDILLEIFLMSLNESSFLRNLINKKVDKKDENLNLNNNCNSASNLNKFLSPNKYNFQRDDFRKYSNMSYRKLGTGKKSINDKDSDYFDKHIELEEKAEDKLEMSRKESILVRVKTINDNEINKNEEEELVEFEKDILKKFKIVTYTKDFNLSNALQSSNKIYILLKGEIYDVSVYLSF